LKSYQRLSDGPTGPLTGGSFEAGELADLPADDWSVLEGSFEFELVSDGSSRTAGGILLDDKLYISCDLGFIWSRLPAGLERNILHVIWWFKTWHERAASNGGIRIRKDGKIYSANIELVRDPLLVEQLKSSLEEAAKEYFAPNELGPRPEKEPNGIWFFLVTQPR